MPFDPPSQDNDYLAPHIALLRRSLKHWTGQNLLDDNCSDAEAAEFLWNAPLVLLSHSTADDPILTYGNRAALDLFELSWDDLVSMPSHLTAEALNRDERAHLLQRVAAHGYIDDYSGVRVSSTGKRFRIERAMVWNLIDEDGAYLGQAAMFDQWTPL